jgi:type II secretory pathway component PulF
MALIVTPSTLERRSEFYHQLGALLKAGVGVLDALQMLAKDPPARAYVPHLKAAIKKIQSGHTLHEALEAQGKWMTELDLALIRAGEQSGMLDQTMAVMADFYAERVKLARQVLSDLAYPLFILHFAILIFPPNLLAVLVWEGRVEPFLKSKLLMFIPLYSATAFLLWSCQSRRSGFWRGFIERVALTIPGLSKATRYLSIARLSMALQALTSAGVSIIEAWDLAADASGSQSIKKEVARAKVKILKGDTPGEVLQQHAFFPDMFRNLYRSGEISGQLDDTLRRLYQHYQIEASRKFQTLSQWVPRIIMLIIMIAVGYFIVTFWSNYFDTRFDPPI